MTTAADTTATTILKMDMDTAEANLVYAARTREAFEDAHGHDMTAMDDDTRAEYLGILRDQRSAGYRYQLAYREYKYATDAW